jgi:eukaryotic-like serine/threonine-protein kinase
MTVERGSSLGAYQIQFLLGSGGMGEVWRARDTRTGREVAIKVISSQAAGDPDLLARFLSEAKATSALRHPNILEVLEVGDRPAPYIVMEYVDGGTVRSLLNDGRLPVAQAVDIARQAAEGVASAHAAGIVHRDLKPENLMITSAGVVKILDFGLAKSMRPEDAAGGGRTATGMIIGTAAYVSPEQLRGAKATERSDVFALGLVLFEMTTGENPFQRNNPVDMFGAILRDDPAPLTDRAPDAPPELSRVLGRALAKKPEDRYPTAAELAEDLRTVPVPAAAPHPAEEAAAAGSRTLTTLLVAGGLLALLAAGVLVLRGC